MYSLSVYKLFSSHAWSLILKAEEAQFTTPDIQGL